MASKNDEKTVKNPKADVAKADLERKEVNLDNGTTTFQDERMEKVTEPVIVQGAASSDNSAAADKQVYVDTVETPVVVRGTRIIDERLTPELVERYKEQNPIKAAAKEEELKRKLAAAKKD